MQETSTFKTKHSSSRYFAKNVNENSNSDVGEKHAFWVVLKWKQRVTLNNVYIVPRNQFANMQIWLGETTTDANVNETAVSLT